MSFQPEDRPERSLRPPAAQKKQNPFANTRLANEVVRSIDAAAARRPARCFTGETASGRQVSTYSPRNPNEVYDLLTEKAGEELVHFWWGSTDTPFEPEPTPTVGDQTRAEAMAFARGEPVTPSPTLHGRDGAPSMATAPAQQAFSPELMAVAMTQLIGAGWAPPGGGAGSTFNPSLRLSDRIRVFVEEIAHVSNRGRTVAYLTTLTMFKQLVGDRLLHDVCADDTDVFMKALRVWPVHREQRNAYRNMLAPAVVRKAEQLKDEPIHLRTQASHLQRLRRFFKWLEARREVRPGLLDKIRLVDQRTPNRRARRPFSAPDLQAIFSSSEITQPNSPYKFWLPMIAFYTGMRIREVAQLTIDDVMEKNGRWYINVDNAFPGQQIKTPQSRRLMPLRDEVLQAGFLDFLRDIKRWQHKRLFPDATWNADGGPGTGPSAWFGNILRHKLGIMDKACTFHSFRHGFATYASQTPNLRSVMISDLLGHWTGPSTLQVVYRSLSSLQARTEAMDAIVFPALSHARYQPGSFDPVLRRLWATQQREARINAVYGLR